MENKPASLEARNLKRLVAKNHRAVTQMLETALRFVMNDETASSSAIFKLERSVGDGHDKVNQTAMAWLRNGHLDPREVVLVFNALKFTSGLSRLSDSIVSILQAPFSINDPNALTYRSHLQMIVEQISQNLLIGLDLCVFNSSQDAFATNALAAQILVVRITGQIRSEATPLAMTAQSSLDSTINLVLLATALERIGSQALSMAREMRAIQA